MPSSNFYGRGYYRSKCGGRVKSSITDLLFIKTFTKGQAVREVIIINHTGKLKPNKLSMILCSMNKLRFQDCGFTQNTDEAVKKQLKAKAPHLALEIDQLYFGAFGSSDM